MKSVICHVETSGLLCVVAMVTTAYSSKHLDKSDTLVAIKTRGSVATLHEGLLILITEHRNCALSSVRLTILGTLDYSMAENVSAATHMACMVESVKVCAMCHARMMPRKSAEEDWLTVSMKYCNESRTKSNALLWLMMQPILW